MKKILLLVILCALPAWALDLNTATTDEIAALKGITLKTAEAIVAARMQTGPFKSSADVLKVSGVTQGILNQNRATLTIGGKSVTTRSGTAPAIPGVRPAIPAKKAAAPHGMKTGKTANEGKNNDSKGNDGSKGNGGNKGGGGNGKGGKP